jgi:hypothetical protein
MCFRLDFRMPMLQASALDGANHESGRLLHPGNAMLRRAIQENLVSFPSQIPVFSRQARPEMQWKAVLLYFVRGWPVCDIAARFGVGGHRISKVVDEWATRAIALGYIQVIDPERFAAWSGRETASDAAAVWRIEQRSGRGTSVEVSRSPLTRVSEEIVVNDGNKGWRPDRSVQPANAGLVTALDVAIRRCEDRPGIFFGQAATLLRDLRSVIEAGESMLPVHEAPASNVSRAPRAPAEEVLYAFNS